MRTKPDVAPDPTNPHSLWGTPPPEVALAAARAARRREQIGRGDYRSVLGQLDRPFVDPTDHERIWGEVAEALHAAARRDPGGFGLEQIDRMVEFLAFLQLRGETSFRQRLVARDRAIASHGLGPDPGHDDPHLERLCELTERLVRLIEARATVERKMGLAARRTASTIPSEAVVGDEPEETP
jgi:hypothetical protein